MVQKSAPAETAEVAHCHQSAHPFFFVLAGTLTLHVEVNIHTVLPPQGIAVVPMQERKLVNNGE